MIEKNKKITGLERYSENGFVFKVGFKYYISEIISEDFRYYADIDLEITYEITEENFLPYEELTEQIVMSWVDMYLDENKIQQIEDKLNAIIYKQKTPDTLSGIPWE